MDELNINTLKIMEYSNKIQNELEILDPYVVKTEIMQYDQPNPFFVPLEGSKFKYEKTKILADSYKHIYILCLVDDYEITTHNNNKIKLFFDSETEISELVGQKKMVTLIRGPFSLIHLQNIRSGMVSISNEILEHFNYDSNDLNNKEMVYLMLEARESVVRSWLKIYESEKNLDKFIEQKIFTSYYKLDDKKTEDKLLSLIGQVGDFNFWKDERNCLLSINNAFGERKFNLSFVHKWNLPIEEIEKELEKLLHDFKENKYKIKNTNYPEQITNPKILEQNTMSEQTIDPFKMKQYVDGFKTDFKSYYPITKSEELEIKLDNIEELLVNHSMNEKEKYYLICNLLVSKNYCHYVINNKNIMDANKEIFEKYKPVFRYLVGYVWISLYMEESIKKTRTKQSDRFVFDIETASKLPVFPYSPQYPYLNPYFTSMVSENLLSMEQNIGSVNQSIDYQNGIVDLEEFKRRLNIFISGKENTNLLNGVNWSNMVITGGTMAAIIPKMNPLMLLFDKITDLKTNINEKILDRFFQEYYAKSDIDVACNHSNIIDFIEHVKHIKNVLQSNLGPTIQESDVRIDPIKTLAIYINAPMLKEKCDRGEIPYKYDYIINNKNKRAVKFYFYEFYLEQKKISNEKNKKILGEKINDDEYFEIIDYCDFEKLVLVINDVSFETEIIENRTPDSNSGLELVYFLKNKNKIPIMSEDKTESEINNQKNNSNNSKIFIKFSETLKYKIISKYLKHSFEIFRIHDIEFFSCIGRFHLPCVRSYYNGLNCYMLPSAITAYQTLTNIDFKYFVGSNDPISIIDKYRNRGYGVILNKIEISQYLSYILTSDHHKKAYGIVDKNDIKNILGCLDVNHDFFKPRKNHPQDFAIDPNIDMNYQNVKIDYASSKNDIIKYYEKNYKKYSSDFVEKRTILPSGEINPFKNWIIDAAYDMLN